MDKTTHVKPMTLVRYWGSFIKSLRAARRIANDLSVPASKGWNTYLVCCFPPEDMTWLQPLLDIGAKIVYLDRPNGNYDWNCVGRTYSLCRDVGCDIFHCENIHTSPLIGATLARVPTRFWTKRSMNSVYEECRKQTLRDRIAISVRISCFLTTRTIAVSKKVKDELVGLGISESKFIVLNNPVDITGEKSSARNNIRTSFGYGSEHIVITTVGHAVPVKGWDYLLRAFSIIAKEIKDVRLLLIGSTTAPHEQNCFEELLTIINEEEIEDKVCFTGHLTDIKDALYASDIYIQSSRSEGFSNALIEGLTAGLPSISTRVGIAEEVILPGYNGYLVEREDLDGLAQMLKKVARNSELRKQLANNAKKPINIPTMEEYSSRLFEIYEYYYKLQCIRGWKRNINEINNVPNEKTK